MSYMDRAIDPALLRPPPQVKEEPVKVEITRACYVFDLELGQMRPCAVGEVVTTTTSHAASVVTACCKGRYV